MDVQPLALTFGGSRDFGALRSSIALGRTSAGIETSAAIDDDYVATQTYGPNATITGLVPAATTAEAADFVLSDGAHVEVNFSTSQTSTATPAADGTTVTNAEEATATATVTDGVAGTTYIPEIVQSLPIQTLGAAGSPTVVTDATGYQLVGVLAMTTSKLNFAGAVDLSTPFGPTASVDTTA
jgi:hypothetical protein